MVATLVRLTGDWDLAEECAQDAFTTALERWPRDGIPRRPGAWLTTVARHRAVDRARRARLGESKTREVAVMAAASEDTNATPTRTCPTTGSRLMFTCCHPALSFEAQVALTLRTLAGMTTPEIAHAFLVPEATMAQRLVRAKRKIRNAGIPFAVPPPHQLVERTAAVLAVLYLLFNEGYSASSGTDLVRGSLTAEAIRLGRVLCTLMPDEPEALGLLALMLFHDARSAARVDADGDLVVLAEQDRALWDAAAIAEGRQRAQRGGPAGPARPVPDPGGHRGLSRPGRAARRTGRRSPSSTTTCTRMTPSAVIALNRAVAVSMSDGPEAGLALLDGIAPDGELRAYHLLPAARADMLRRLGRRAEAAEAYRRAFDLAGTDAERRYLQRRLLEATATAAGLTGRGAVAIVSPGPPPAGGRSPTNTRGRLDHARTPCCRTEWRSSPGRGGASAVSTRSCSPPSGPRSSSTTSGGAVDGSGADISAAQSVVDEITAAGGQAVANTDSVSSFEGAKAMVDQAVSTFGDLHVVVNNAGILRDRMLVSMSEQEFDDVIAVHLKGTFNLTRHAADVWRDAAKTGTITDRAIVNTSSGAGLHGNVGQTNYSAAKAGIAIMTVVNAMELQPLRRAGQLHRPGGADTAHHADARDGRGDAAAPVRSRERLAARRRAGVGRLSLQRPGLQRLRRFRRHLRRVVDRRLGGHRRPLDRREPGDRHGQAAPHGRGQQPDRRARQAHGALGRCPFYGVTSRCRVPPFGQRRVDVRPEPERTGAGRSPG